MNAVCYVFAGLFGGMAIMSSIGRMNGIWNERKHKSATLAAGVCSLLFLGMGIWHVWKVR
jgi:putative Ca2+/H+ antiporter (TMEM165/GDT1 family)